MTDGPGSFAEILWPFIIVAPFILVLVLAVVFAARSLKDISHRIADARRRGNEREMAKRYFFPRAMLIAGIVGIALQVFIRSLGGLALLILVIGAIWTRRLNNADASSLRSPLSRP